MFYVFFFKGGQRPKWVPLDIDQAKSRSKRDKSPRHHRNGDGKYLYKNTLCNNNLY
jgi:hypothetical protein